MKRTRKSTRQDRRSGNHLQFERLEQRTLLAVASFYFDFYEDAGGVPGALIADNTVEAGEEFFVEIRAQEHDPRFSGLADISLDIAWDAPLLDVVEPFDASEAVTPNLPVLIRGTLHQDGNAVFAFLLNNELRRNIGHIDGLGGSSLSSLGAGHPIGSDGNDRYVKETLRGLSTTDDHFAWLHFQAEQPGESVFTMRQGRLRISTLPVANLTAAHLRFETKTLTIVAPSETNSAENSIQPIDAVVAELSTPPTSPAPSTAPQVVAMPRIEVTMPSERVQFTTAIDSAAAASPLVRPAFPDDDKFIEVSNTGDAPLNITEIRVNVPDVTVASGDPPIVVQPGETKKLGLTYAPSTPNATDATVQSFDVSNGLVIVSNAANAPVVEVGLRGDSTFDADTNYDGQVDLADLISFEQHFGLQAGDDNYSPQIDPNGDGVIDVTDLRPFAAHYNRSRDVPLIAPVLSSARTSAEGEGHTISSSSTNVCVAGPGLRTEGSLAPPVAARSELKTTVRSTSFVGPLLPHERATHLLLADPTNRLASLADPNQLDDELVDVLATDVES
jgi:hypothetical protein